jgi:deoxyribonuclease V
MPASVIGLSDYPWDVTPSEAVTIQGRLRGLVETSDRLGSVSSVAGIDVSVRGDRARAAIVLLSFPDLGLLEVSLADGDVTFPYVPGLLAFREAPVILAAYARLRTKPDLLMVDGHGLAHPRRMGIASHLGVVLDRPSLGCAKSRLCGLAAEPAMEAGCWEPLRDGDDVIGAVVRTRTGVRPVYVSIGHRVGLETAVRYVLACCQGRRLPEPTRRAHQAGSLRGPLSESSETRGC